MKYFGIILDFTRFNSNSGLQIYKDLNMLQSKVIPQTYMNLKTDEMFDILQFIISERLRAKQDKEGRPDWQLENTFPSCIHELKMTLQNITRFENMHFKLAEKMKEQIIDRLLIPGVDSKSIINFYIQVIRVFKFIDPSTILLEIISKPIKDYLRSRKDTLRCIVSIIIEDESELYSQLGN